MIEKPSTAHAGDAANPPISAAAATPRMAKPMVPRVILLLAPLMAPSCNPPNCRANARAEVKNSGASAQGLRAAIFAQRVVAARCPPVVQRAIRAFAREVA